MTRKQKNTLIRIIAAGVLLIAAALLPFEEKSIPRLIAFLVPYFVIGWDVLWKAVRGIIHGQVFDENFLMCVATVGALFVGEYPEAASVMLFYQIGELFQGVAVGKSRQSISDLMDICPEYANLERDGQLEEVAPEEVELDSIIVIKPGEKIPLDGVVIEGSSSVDTSALTGESLPREIGVGDEVVSGCINQGGLLKVRVTKEYEDSTVTKILELVENSASKKAKAENFITRFARYYTPSVVFAALALAVLPPLITGGNWGMWIHRALIFLVISCPCALVISVPLSFFGGIGGASKRGILVKGGNYLEALASAETVVFDKTGTLTEGVFEVSAVHPELIGEKELLHLAAQVERYSSHPIAEALRTAYGNESDDCEVSDVSESAGRGVKAIVNGRTVCAGNVKMMEEAGCEVNDCPKCNHAGTVVHVAIDGVYAGHIVISDRIRPESAEAVKAVKAEGVGKTFMLTGDSAKVAAEVADTLGLEGYCAELLPEGKLNALEKLMKDTDGNLAFVGDGLNDAPALARADVGIAMGGLGSDAAIEAADVVLMDDNPSKIAVAIRTARKTIGIARQNIVFAIVVKIAVLLLAAFGLAPMWLAVFADVGVTVLAVLNAMRLLVF